MKLNIIASEAAKASNEKAYALFFVKESIQFSKVLSNKALDQAESVLKGMKDGPFEDLEFLEIRGLRTGRPSCLSVQILPGRGPCWKGPWKTGWIP